MKFWTPEEREILKQNYTKVKSLKELLPLFPDREYDGIRSMANVMGLFRTVPHTKDKTFFNIPNILNCSIAGFIAADGCITENKKIKRLAIGLAIKDEDYLLKIKDLLKYSGPLTYQTYNYHFDNKTKNGIVVYDGTAKRCDLQICDCKDFVENLQKYWNIAPRKTLTLMPPNLSDTKLMMAFISGLIDGDGWIYKDKELYNIGIMGTLELMTWVKNTFDYLVPLGSNCQLTHESNKNTYSYKVSGVKVYWLAKIFLSLDIIRMHRKWNLLKEYIDKVEKGDLTSNAKNKLIKVKPSQETLDLFEIKTNFQCII